MLLVESTRHQVAIAGQVTDAQTGRPLARARVQISDIMSAPFARKLTIMARQYGSKWEAMSERPDRAQTAVDGFFHFLDLPAGNYTLKASLPAAGSRYGTAVVTVSISQGNVSMVAADITLPPTRIHGQVTRSDNSDPLPNAKIRLKGDTQVVLTDGNGEYTLTGLVAGNPTVEVTAVNFAMTTQAITLEAGQDLTVNFVLQPA